MSYRLLTPDLVRAIHDAVLNPGELPGEERNKSLEGALGRVDNRLAYGMIGDVFDLAAAYAAAIATGHVFNDANTRTAFRTMSAAMAFNGIQIAWDAGEIGPLIVAAARGRVDDQDLAAWLRSKANG